MTRPWNDDLEGAVAVVAMTGIFPGAPSLEALWPHLRDGRDLVTFFSDDALDEAGVPKQTRQDPNFVPAAAILDAIDRFDAEFFGLSPLEAALLDPQHRLFLQNAWHALEAAGYDTARYPGAIGVFVSSSLSTYGLGLQRNPALLDSVGGYQVMLSTDKDFLPTRVSYKLGLRGPSVNVQAACASSLMAVHIAYQSVVSGESDLALAGGVSIRVPQTAGYVFQEGGILSPDGHCRPYDARAQGTVQGEGLGIVVLKALDRALEDGDSIRAVIRGSAATNDGSLKASYSAPGVEGQARAIVEALELADVEARSIGLVEGHGTGTTLGDPIEVQALTQAYRLSTEARQFCALGSIKSNIGHLDAAAGIAGMIKAILALEHRVLPPTAHFQEPNPRMELPTTPFYVLAEAKPWASDRPRRAGVSAFGLGGTNVHVILEEAPFSEPGDPDPRPERLLVLSARTEDDLRRLSESWSADLARRSEDEWSDASYTALVGRRKFEHRLAVVGQTREQWTAGLSGADPTRRVTVHHEGGTRSVAFLFPGGGAQYPNMGRGLYDTSASFRRDIDHCLEHLHSRLGEDLRLVLYPEPGQEEQVKARLEKPSLALPTLFATEYALARLWMACGVEPKAMIGHSFGEYVVACLAGVFTLEEALDLAVKRCELFETLPPGAMLTVPLAEAELLEILPPELAIAALNAPDGSLVSGPIEQIEAFQQVLAERALEAKRVRIDVASHSPMVEPIVQPLEAAVGALDAQAPRRPYLSGVTGTWIRPEEATDPTFWGRHVRQPVRYADGVAELLKLPEVVLIEVGPGQTLSELARRQIPPNSPAAAIASMRHPRDRRRDREFWLQTLGAAWCHGVEIEASALHSGRRRRIALPTYPFAGPRHWIAPARGATTQDSPGAQNWRIQDDAPSTTRTPQRVIQRQDEPRDAIEKALAEVWQEHLGVTEIGRLDDFFALGGTSLLAVRIASRLSQRFGQKVRSRVLLESPTLAELGEALRPQLESGVIGSDAFDVLATGPSSLVKIQAGNGKPRLFLVHPGGGHVFFYRDLARELGAEWPVYGFEALGLADDRQPLSTIETLAEHHLNGLRSLQPKGPYLLGGSSVGGMIAFEMAQILRAAGEEVALLALLDTPGPGQLPQGLDDDIDLILYLFGELSEARLSREELQNLPPNERIAQAIQRAEAAGGRFGFDAQLASRIFRVFKANVQAMESYQPAPYQGPLTFFRATERRAWDPPHPERSWLPYSADLFEVRPVPGDHITMHETPHLPVLGQQLRKSLLKAVEAIS